MRFLLFNIAVVLALFYLFSMEREEFRAVAQRLDDGLAKAHGAAEEAADRSADNATAPGLVEDTPQPVPAPAQAPVDGSAAAPDQPAIDAVGSEDWAQLLAELDAEAKAGAEAAEANQSVLQARTAEAASASPAPVPAVPAEAVLAQGLLPVDDPAVVRRRAEVLEGLDLPLPEDKTAAAAGAAATPAAAPRLQLAEGEVLMSNEERLKQLYVLAEEMELLFVRQLAK